MLKQNGAESSPLDILDIKLKPAIAHLRPTATAERRNMAARETLQQRIRAEFQMQGMSVTSAQAARLFGITPDAASRILTGMVDARVLNTTADHRYVLRALA